MDKMTQIFQICVIYRVTECKNDYLYLGLVVNEATMEKGKEN